MLRRLVKPSKSVGLRFLRESYIPKAPILRAAAITTGLLLGAVVQPISYSEAKTVIPLIPVSEVVLQPADDEENIIYQALQAVASFGTWIMSCLHVVFRCGKLCLTFTPALATLPITLVFPTESVANWWWGIFRSCICYAGPTYIKFAQWAAMRHDLFASRVCLQLSKLQSETRPHSWKQTVAALDRILGEGWQDTLNLHQDSLIGSGCVGQVYKGRMRVNDSQGTHYRDVAIKILHPGVRRSMELDLTLMRSGARMAEWVGEVLLPLLYSHKGHPDDPEADSVPLRCISLMESVKEFAEFMMSQLDLRHEALALDHFRQNFSKGKWAEKIIIPAPVQVPNPTGEGFVAPHEDLLIETYEGGIPMTKIINQVVADEANQGTLVDSVAAAHTQEKYKAIAALGLDAILKMLFEDNFVHADLHAGNIMLREVTDSYGIKHPQLVLLDAGLTAELGPYDQRNFVGLFRAVIDNDGREVGRLMMEGNQMRDKNGRRIPVIKPEEYQDEMAKLVAYVHAKGLSLKNVSVSDLLRDVLRLSYDHNVKLESRFVTVVVALMLAEGMGRRLDPDVDIIKRATPFIRAAAIRKFMGYK